MSHDGFLKEESWEMMLSVNVEWIKQLLYTSTSWLYNPFGREKKKALFPAEAMEIVFKQVLDFIREEKEEYIQRNI